MTRAAVGERNNRLETDVNGTLVLIDVDAVWCETFAHWDCLVSSSLAEKIATATARLVREEAKEHGYEYP